MPTRDSNNPNELEDIIEQTRTWIRGTEAEYQGRGRDRRRAERRVMGFAARRNEKDAELNHHRRTFLLSYLRQLPEETLWLWIDGLWLGHSTDAQLAALVTSARESASAGALNAPQGPQSLGRSDVDPLRPGVQRVHDASTRAEWKSLTQQLGALSQFRQKHHAALNRARDRKPRSLDIRNACLKSPIGLRVNRARLFAEFFDHTHLSAGEMAARLLHRELLHHLTTIKKDALTEAVMADSEGSRDMAAAQATKAAQLLRALPKWRTLYGKLRERR